MKFRHGFVSNSSSSSFIAIINEDTFNPDNFPAIVQSYLEQCDLEKYILDGKSLVLFQRISGERGYDVPFDRGNFALRAREIAEKTKEDLSNWKNLIDDENIEDAKYEAENWLEHKYFRMLEQVGKCITRMEHW